MLNKQVFCYGLSSGPPYLTRSFTVSNPLPGHLPHPQRHNERPDTTAKGRSCGGTGGVAQRQWLCDPVQAHALKEEVSVSGARTAPRECLSLCAESHRLVSSSPISGPLTRLLIWLQGTSESSSPSHPSITCLCTLAPAPSFIAYRVCWMHWMDMRRGISTSRPLSARSWTW